jgi:hypothetical protein
LEVNKAHLKNKNHNLYPNPLKKVKIGKKSSINVSSSQPAITILFK